MATTDKKTDGTASWTMLARLLTGTKSRPWSWRSARSFTSSAGSSIGAKLSIQTSGALMGDSKAPPRSDERTSEVRPRRVQAHDPDPKSSGVGLHGQTHRANSRIGSAGDVPNASRVFSGSWRRKVSSRLSGGCSDRTVRLAKARETLAGERDIRQRGPAGRQNRRRSSPAPKSKTTVLGPSRASRASRPSVYSCCAARCERRREQRFRRSPLLFRRQVALRRRAGRGER